MSNIYSGIMGLVVGDALGVPYEFKMRDSFHADDMTGFGTHNQPAGTWSDDSSMTLATLESITRLGTINPSDIMDNFVKWYRDKEFTPHGSVFDIGGATSAAIRRYEADKDISKCGGTNIYDNGNGALMRIFPLAFTDCGDDVIDVVGGLTHNHEISREACRIYVRIARRIIGGKSLSEIIAEIDVRGEEFLRLHEIAGLNRDEIKSGGYVVDTLEAALWCLRNTDNYRDCVLTAVNLGSDTDTTAAVAGGLAGILYGIGGENGIPAEWISAIAKKEQIKALCGKFEASVQNAKATPHKDCCADAQSDFSSDCTMRTTQG